MKQRRVAAERRQCATKGDGEKQFLFETLELAGLHSGFVGMVRALYSQPRSAVLVNGRVSENFGIERGVRQGCPLSPALYVLAIEPLLQRLAKDARVDRFPRPGGAECDVPLFAYAAT